MVGEGVGRGGHCRVCGGRFKRNGVTSAGRTRWRCTKCGASATRQRPDVTARAEFARFLRWLLGPLAQHDAASVSGRSFRRRIAWCWQVQPRLTSTGEVFTEVQVDGIYLSTGWCCLIASTGGRVLAWQWCDREKTAAWTALLLQIPAPRVVICDGGNGLLQALADVWPDTRVQRCLVHVQRNVRTQLTSKPRTDAGKALWALACSLTRITDTEQAVAWLQHLNTWYELYGHLTRERTYLAKHPEQAPAGLRPGQRWWYTHERLRRAYRLLAKLAQRRQLFTYLETAIAGETISSTTNTAEGAINAGLRDMLRRHRGMPEEHQRRAVEWWLHAHAHDTQPAWSFASVEQYRPTVNTSDDIDDEPEPSGDYDTGLSAEEGLWSRRGWAGHS